MPRRSKPAPKAKQRAGQKLVERRGVSPAERLEQVRFLLKTRIINARQARRLVRIA